MKIQEYVGLDVHKDKTTVAIAGCFALQPDHDPNEPRLPVELRVLRRLNPAESEIPDKPISKVIAELHEVKKQVLIGLEDPAEGTIVSPVTAG